MLAALVVLFICILQSRVTNILFFLVGQNLSQKVNNNFSNKEENRAMSM